MSPHIETPRCNKQQPGGQPRDPQLSPDRLRILGHPPTGRRAFDPVTPGKRLSSRGAITESIRYASRSADVAQTLPTRDKFIQT